MANGINIPLITLVLLSVLQGSCNIASFEDKQAKENKAKEDVRAKKLDERNKMIEELSKRYGADGTSLNKLHGTRLTTLSLQNALVLPNGQPVVAPVSILDVEKRNRDYSFYLFLPHSSSIFGHKVYVFFKVTCELPAMELKLAKSPYPFSWRAEYLVTARINDVNRSHRFLHSKDELDEIETEFVASGQCIDLKPIQAVIDDTQP